MARQPSRQLATPADIAALSAPVATTRDGRDITRPYVRGLQQPRDPRLLRSVDWGVYDRILEDDQVFLHAPAAARRGGLARLERGRRR